jgi:predicted AlkP superfamily pyrophosphatase or phosphodiesterase
LESPGDLVPSGRRKLESSRGFRAVGVPHAPDLVPFGEEGCAFGDTAAGELPFNEKPERKGSHGYDANLPGLPAIFVAWGGGIKPGARLGEISSTSVAPTLARLLGLTLPDAEGQPLTAALAP